MKHDVENQPITSIETCMNIVDSTMGIIGNRELSDISVNEICEAADISRTTFYYHFDDKFDIIQWHYDYVAQRNLFLTGRNYTWFQAHYKNTREVLKKRELYLAAFASRGYQSLFSYSKRRRVESLKTTIVEYKKMALDEELGFQIYALADAEVASMSRWFKDGMPFDLETLCKYLEGIVPRRLHDLLADPVDPILY